MNCPVCGCETLIYDSRRSVDAVWRRRKCKVCGHRFSTVEVEKNWFDRQLRIANEISDAICNIYRKLMERK